MELVVGGLYSVIGLALLSMCFELMKDEFVAKVRWVGRQLHPFTAPHRGDVLDENDLDNGDGPGGDHHDMAADAYQVQQTGFERFTELGSSPEEKPPSSWKKTSTLRRRKSRCTVKEVSLSNADLEPAQKHPGCILRSHSNCSHRPINKRGDDNLAFSAEQPNVGT